jgi:hypothetical protein
MINLKKYFNSMGTPYKKPVEKVVVEAFVRWFDNLEFKDDDEMFKALNEIESEVTVRLSDIGEAAVDRAEAEGSAP